MSASDASNPVASDNEHSDTDDGSDFATDGDTFGTPGEPDAATSTHTPGMVEQDNEVILKAARRMRELLVEVLQDLKQHAPTRLTADIKITIGDRRTFDLTVGNASPDEDRLVVKINPAAAPATTTTTSTTTTTTAAAPTETRKRPAESPPEVIDLTAPKRPRENGASHSPAQPAPMPRASDLARAARQTQHDKPAADPAATALLLLSPPQEEGSDAESDPDEPGYLKKEFRLLAKRVQWVEQCRRAAAAEYHGREERWRTTSASFHDDSRIKREKHEAWVAGEMARQLATLGQLVSDVRGLYPLVHAAKSLHPAPHPLYTPPAPPPPPPPPPPEPPVGVAYDTPVSFSSPYLRQAQLHRELGERGRTRGRPRGRPRMSGVEMIGRLGLSTGRQPT